MAARVKIETYGQLEQFLVDQAAQCVETVIRLGGSDIMATRKMQGMYDAMRVALAAARAMDPNERLNEDAVDKIAGNKESGMSLDMVKAKTTTAEELSFKSGQILAIRGIRSAIEDTGEFRTDPQSLY